LKIPDWLCAARRPIQPKNSISSTSGSPLATRAVSQGLGPRATSTTTPFRSSSGSSVGSPTVSGKIVTNRV
jgi:hypothetical protein